MLTGQKCGYPMVCIVSVRDFSKTFFLIRLFEPRFLTAFSATSMHLNWVRVKCGIWFRPYWSGIDKPVYCSMTKVFEGLYSLIHSSFDCKYILETVLSLIPKS